MSEDIVSGNKMIAEFMKGGKIKFNPNHIRGLSKQLTYHKDWRRLMPVVEKIEDLEYQVEIELFSCVIFETKYLLDNSKGMVIESHENNKINATWQAVITFIQWYNTQIKQGG